MVFFTCRPRLSKLEAVCPVFSPAFANLAKDETNLLTLDEISGILEKLEIEFAISVIFPTSKLLISACVRRFILPNTFVIFESLRSTVFKTDIA